MEYNINEITLSDFKIYTEYYVLKNTKTKDSIFFLIKKIK